MDIVKRKTFWNNILRSLSLVRGITLYSTEKTCIETTGNRFTTLPSSTLSRDIDLSFYCKH